MVKYLLVTFTAFALLSCMSFENRLKYTERSYGVEAAFWQAVAKYDSEPRNVEYKTFLDYYGNRAISQLIARADYQLANNEYDKLYSTLYFGRNSATAIIEAYQARGFNHILSNKPNEMRPIVDKSFSDFYLQAINYFNNSDYQQALQAFSKMRSFRDSEKYIRFSQNEIKYITAANTLGQGNYRTAYRLFTELPDDMRDVLAKREECLARGRIVIAVEPFEGYGSDFIYRKVLDEIKNDKFISILELENVQKYGSLNPTFFQNNNIDFILSAKAEYLFNGPITRDYDGIYKVWRVSEDKKIVYSSKKDGKICSEFIFKSQPASYYIRESFLSADVNFAYKLVRIRDFATYATKNFSVCYEDKIDYHIADRGIRIGSLTLRNPQLDTLYTCQPVNNFYFEFSPADIHFQEQFYTKEHQSDKYIMDWLLSHVAHNAWRELANTLKKLEKI